ncbi:MAG: hypothetical protein HQM04_05015 [Magnetococcales bacterium]|nr:hypothetical protein [Magnetococcales bacterium]MBF0114386.1 hypothetical protein [Magnetococcales bacterium]
MTMLLLGIVLGVATPMLSMLLEGYLLAKASASASSAATLALQRMVGELHSADPTSLQLGSNQISFQNNSGTTTLAQTNDNDPRIMLTQQGDSQPLLDVAQNNSLRFTRLTPTLLAISFTVTIPLAQGSPLLQPFTTAVHLSGP